jgi:VCBS repeat-containing protein
VVTNNGNVALSGISLTDSDFSLSGASVPSTLEAGASFEYILTGITAVAGQHSNTATASGLYNQQTYRDTDMAHYFGYEPKFERKTDHDQPVSGKVDLPDEAAPRIGRPPANGTATVDEDGNWIYTPNFGFSGKDVFTIIVRQADGTEYEVTIEIMVEEPAGGLIDKPLISTPRTAGVALAAIYSLWLIMMASFVLRRAVSAGIIKWPPSSANRKRLPG